MSLLALIRDARATGDADTAIDAILQLGYSQWRARIACGLLPICSGCHGEIDPNCCWCGTENEHHTGYDGHAFVPMGCTCLGDADELAHEFGPLRESLTDITGCDV